MPTKSPLGPVRRVVTFHNNESKAIVSQDSLIDPDILPHGNSVALLWSSDISPADVSSADDKGLAQTGISNNGSVLRFVDFPPHSTGLLHRTISLDYIVVQHGSLCLTLDDGSKTKLRVNDVVVQQATMHGWDNDGDEWARILCVLTSAKAPVINGVPLETSMSFEVNGH